MTWTAVGPIRVCSICKVEKHETEFSFRASGSKYRRSECKPCRTAASRRINSVRYREDPVFRARVLELSRRSALLKRYGLTPEEADALLASQGGLCAICGEVPPIPNIDHDHASGAIRGVLCYRCNVGIGYFRDRPALLVRAASYLSRSGYPVVDVSVEV